MALMELNNNEALFSSNMIARRSIFIHFKLFFFLRLLCLNISIFLKLEVVMQFFHLIYFAVPVIL